mgnify:FL=1
MYGSNDLSLSVRIDGLLPQTQCRRCGYPDCQSYAEAISLGEAAINRCPPGGAELIAALAQLTRQQPVGLDESCGRHGPLQLARIDESRCIGCTLCIAACPVDAIAGAPKRMHTVLAAWCTGCELCIAPCPVDCIELTPFGRAWSVPDAQAARLRYAHHSTRKSRKHDVSDLGVDVSDREPEQVSTGTVLDLESRQRAVAAAISRARARRERANEAGQDDGNERRSADPDRKLNTTP